MRPAARFRSRRASEWLLVASPARARESSDMKRHTDGPWIEMASGPDAPGAHILAIQGLHPAGLRAHAGLYRTLMFGPSPLSRAEREAIAVVVSAANDCFY